MGGDSTRAVRGRIGLKMHGQLQGVANPVPIHSMPNSASAFWPAGVTLGELSAHIKPRSPLMAQAKWRLEGEWIKNCNCAFGCPCDFNAKPTHGSCKGLLGMRITKGHFGGTKLDGLVFMVTVDFPGPLHEGNGQIQPIVDERATPEQ